MVSGMALGVCGAVYQILFANPLAAPDIMGVSGGATLGAAMAIVWGNTAFSAPAAFLGGMAALAGSLLLTGCAAKSPVFDTACPQLPQKPIVTRPTPPSTYSESASNDIKRWRKRLTDTQTMQ